MLKTGQRNLKHPPLLYIFVQQIFVSTHCVPGAVLVIWDAQGAHVSPPGAHRLVRGESQARLPCLTCSHAWGVPRTQVKHAPNVLGMVISLVFLPRTRTGI